MRRRADLAGWLGYLYKMALSGKLPFSRGDRVSRMGCVGPKPRLRGRGPPRQNAVPRGCGAGVAPHISRCRRDCEDRGAYQVNPGVHLPLTR
jgi:hypothetical protein